MPTQTKSGTEVIMVGRDTGALRMLRVEHVSGTVHLLRVRVDLRNGRTDLFHVDRVLDARHRTAYIDFGKTREIDQIAVTTTKIPEGWYSVSGRVGVPVPRDQLIAHAPR